MSLLIELLGSIALLLWGLRMVRTGVMRSYGNNLKSLARRSEGKTLPAFTSGLLVAALLQSSTAAILISASFAGQGLISVGSAFITMLGADVGTSVAVLIASQKFTTLAPLLLAMGVFGFIGSKVNKWQNVFRAISGLGLILFALSLIASTAGGLSELTQFTALLNIFEDQPIFFILLALILTYLSYSSLAIVLLSVSFLATGVIGVSEGLYLVLGANLGSGMLPLISNWRGSIQELTPVLANLIVRVVCILAFYPFVDFVATFGLKFVSIELFPAIYHLSLNLIVAIVGVIFSKNILMLAAKMLSNLEEKELSQPSFLEANNFAMPAISLASAKREAIHMAEISQKMVVSSLAVLRDDNIALRSEVIKNEDIVDNIFDSIKLYIARILQEELTPTETQKALNILNFTTSMEHIGDIINNSLMDISGKKIDKHIQFSKEGLNEIISIHEVVCSNYDLAINTFVSDDCELARVLYEKKQELHNLEKRSVTKHLQRIGKGITDSLETSSMHIDVIRDYKKVNSLLSSVAYPILIASGEILESGWKQKI
ncbi:Na/Pi cotransporter family protein [Candidatus Pseudothioglobus sp. Uisw_041]|uniref:Na/Pi cotransporter family protein n=1 Tax=Candidatus Pseudothioglobus sp. Uisw_041 TaxID=3230996 RepID=UPI003A8662ED